MAAGRKGSWSGGGASDGELLVGTADRLRWRAPELALEFARQAAKRADAAQDRTLSLRANALAVASLVRLGKHAEAVEPAVRALREAEAVGARDLTGPLRVDLAASTRAVGLAGSALVLVRPMLESSDERPAVRAGALAEIVGGLAQAGRRGVVDEVLSEADRLYAVDESLTGDVRRMLRALLCARIASFRRRWGNATGAVAAATEGMTLLDGLSDPGAESGQARAELGLEMVSALLDAGEWAAALGQAEQSLNQPIRATSAAATGRLMFVLATRVHIPAGRAVEAHGMFAEIVRMARRHGLDALLADVLTSLAHEQETAGELTDALTSLRSARAAEHRRLRADTLARLIVLEELGAGTKLPDDTEALLRRVVRSPARSFPESPEASAPGMAVGEPRWPEHPGDSPGERDAETGLLNRQGLRRRLAAARRQTRPTALTLVRLDSTPELEPEQPPKSTDPDSTDRYSASLIQSLDQAGGRAAQEVDPDVLSSLAGHVRDMAPEHAELVRPEEGELAVLMPDTTRDEAEQFAATLRETMSTSDWDLEDPARGVSVSTGVAQYEGTSEDAFLTAAREDLTSTDSEIDNYIKTEHISSYLESGNSSHLDSHLERPAWQSVEPVYDMPSDDMSFGGVKERAEGYTYIEEYPIPPEEPERADAEMDAYLAGFPLPEYGQQWPTAEEPEPQESDPQPAKHDAASTSDAGTSVLDRLGITRSGGGGRRRAPDSFEFEQIDAKEFNAGQFNAERDAAGRGDRGQFNPKEPSPQQGGAGEFGSRESTDGFGSWPRDDPGQVDSRIFSAEELDSERFGPGQFDPYETDSHQSGPHHSDPYQSLRNSAADAPSSGTGDEILAAAAAVRASIPQPPEPEAIPERPDSPDIPIPPDPDIDPKPRRRRTLDPLDPLTSPEIPVPPNPDIEPTSGRRRAPIPQPEPPESQAPTADSEPVAAEPDRSAWRRKFATKPRETSETETAARRRRAPVVPPDPSEPMDPPVDPSGSNETPHSAGLPSRLRKREKTDVGLGDLLAEALVAYQSSHSDTPDEDILPAYDDLSATAGPLGPDSGRHRFPDRASAERDTH